MSDGVMIALILGIVLVLVAALALAGYVLRIRMDQPRKEYDTVVNGARDEQHPAPTGDDDEVVKQPIPFDAENLPHRVTYNPRLGSPERICHCHDRVVQPGQSVWWWPLPDSPAVLLICDDAIPKGREQA